MLRLLALLALEAVIASAVVVPSPLFCFAITEIVTVLQQEPEATPFCSSFLGIKTSTATATSTSVIVITIPSTTTTGTITSTAPAVTTTVTAATSTMTSTVITSGPALTSIVASCPPAARHDKRSLSLPSVLTTLPAVEISSACSCLNIPTPTTTTTRTVSSTRTATSTVPVAAGATTTPTSTVTTVPVTTVSTTSTNRPAPSVYPSSALGLQWAEFDNAAGRNTEANYPQFDPTVYQTESPNFSGQTRNISGYVSTCSSPTVDYYGDTISCMEYVMNYRGYVLTSTGGTYTFTVSDGVDDILEFWTGADAYSGYTRQNELFEGTYPNSTTFTHTVMLPANSYVPLRIIFANAQGFFANRWSLTDPAGNLVEDYTTQSSSTALLAYSCDGGAPPYPPYGSET